VDVPGVGKGEPAVNYNREYVERLYTDKCKLFVAYCYEIVEDEAQAEDCVQEAFLAALSIDYAFDNYEHATRFVHIVAKRSAIQLIRRRIVRRRHADALNYLAETVQQPNSGLFNYHPLTPKVMQGLTRLKEATQLAIVAYMYSIPLNALSVAMGLNGSNMHTLMVAGLRQLKRYTAFEHIEAETKMQRDPITDKVWNLRQGGMPFKQIAAHLELNVQAVTLRYHRRKKAVERHPDFYKDIAPIYGCCKTA